MSEESSFEEALETLRALSPELRKKAFATLRKERSTEEEEKQNRLRDMPNEHFSKAYVLQKIPNPQSAAYEQKIYIPEFTFVGAINQPDFGEILLTFYPKNWTIELKSLKNYKDSFRDAPMSYERLANVMFDDLIQVYEPIRLRLMMRLRPRGGISSCLTIDSDWSIRGGKEEFSDWSTNTDRFGFETHIAAKLL